MRTITAILAVLLSLHASGATVTKTAVAPDGTEIQCDLPVDLQVRNRGGSDGAGLCVFASLKHAAVWQNVEALESIFEWMFTHPGGGWPEKVDQVIGQICKDKGVPKPDYIHIHGSDLEPIKLALKTGRIVCVTYSFSPSGRYGGQKIAHMVNVLHCDDQRVCLLDNNFPGTYEWMTPQEFLRSYAYRGPGWAIVFLAEGPPPAPFN